MSNLALQSVALMLFRVLLREKDVGENCTFLYVVHFRFTEFDSPYLFYGF